MPATYSIEVNDLLLYARHGVDDQERRVGNDFSVTLHVYLDLSRPMADDTLADTISYADLIDIIKAEMATPSRLIEHAAGRIHRAVTARYPQITGGYLRVCKLTPPAGPLRLASACITHRW